MSDTFRPTYRTLTSDEKALIEKMKETASSLLSLIESSPRGRETSIAKTKLEESIMWAVKGVTT